MWLGVLVDIRRPRKHLKAHLSLLIVFSCMLHPLAGSPNLGNPVKKVIQVEGLKPTKELTGDKSASDKDNFDLQDYSSHEVSDSQREIQLEKLERAADCEKPNQFRGSDPTFHPLRRYFEEWVQQATYLHNGLEEVSGEAGSKSEERHVDDDEKALRPAGQPFAVKTGKPLSPTNVDIEIDTKAHRPASQQFAVETGKPFSAPSTADVHVDRKALRPAGKLFSVETGKPLAPTTVDVASTGDNLNGLAAGRNDNEDVEDPEVPEPSHPWRREHTPDKKEIGVAEKDPQVSGSSHPPRIKIIPGNHGFGVTENDPQVPGPSRLGKSQLIPDDYEAEVARKDPQVSGSSDPWRSEHIPDDYEAVARKDPQVSGSSRTRKSQLIPDNYGFGVAEKDPQVPGPSRPRKSQLIPDDYEADVARKDPQVSGSSRPRKSQLIPDNYGFGVAEKYPQVPGPSRLRKSRLIPDNYGVGVARKDPQVSGPSRPRKSQLISDNFAVAVAGKYPQVLGSSRSSKMLELIRSLQSYAVEVDRSSTLPSSAGSLNEISDSLKSTSNPRKTLSEETGRTSLTSEKTHFDSVDASTYPPSGGSAGDTSLDLLEPISTRPGISSASKLATCSRPGGCSCRDWIAFVGDGYNRESSRVCDGVCDCPLCEDETGCAVELSRGKLIFLNHCQHVECRQCSKGERYCAEEDVPDNGCYSETQECDGFEDCVRSGKDEKNCFKLDHPSFQHQTMFPTLPRGLLFRKIAGKWLLVCNSAPTFSPSLAEKTCTQIVGPFLKTSPKITINVRAMPLTRISYAVLENDKWYMRSRCHHTHVHILCPPPVCNAGTEGSRGKRKRSLAKYGDEETPDPSSFYEDGFFQGYFSFWTKSHRDDALLVDTGDDRVITGKPMMDIKYPWLVLIRISGKSGSRGICVGTLINHLWILSAAHCFTFVNSEGELNNYQDHHYEVSAGLSRLSSASPFTQVRSGVKVVIHESYSGMYFQRAFDGINDVAMMKVEFPFHFNIHVHAMCLPGGGFSDHDDCVIAGWDFDTRSGDFVDSLREVKAPIWTRCSPVSSIERLSDKLFCAGYTRDIGQAFQGAFGGPLICRSETSPTVVGILSNYASDLTSIPGIYTRVSRYVPWIYRTLRKGSEQNIEESDNQLGYCPGMFCDDGRCILPEEMCDGVVDCPTSGFDETRGCKLKGATFSSFRNSRHSEFPSKYRP